VKNTIKIEFVGLDSENPKNVIVSFSYTVNETVEKSSLKLPLTASIQEDIRKAVKAFVEKRRLENLFSLAKEVEGEFLET